MRIKADKSMQIGRREILRISSRCWWKGGLIGLGLGFGAGAVLGATHPADFKRSDAAMLGGTAFGLIGFLAGAAVGKEQTIYQSPTAQTEEK